MNVVAYTRITVQDGTIIIIFNEEGLKITTTSSNVLVENPTFFTDESDESNDD